MKGESAEQRVDLDAANTWFKELAGGLNPNQLMALETAIQMQFASGPGGLDRQAVKSAAFAALGDQNPSALAETIAKGASIEDLLKPKPKGEKPKEAGE